MDDALTLSILAIMAVLALALPPLRQAENGWWSLPLFFMLGLICGPLLTGLLAPKMAGAVGPVFLSLLVLLPALSAARIGLGQVWAGHRGALLAFISASVLLVGLVGAATHLLIGAISLHGGLILGCGLLLVTPAIGAGQARVADRQFLNIAASLGPLIGFALFALIYISLDLSSRSFDEAARDYVDGRVDTMDYLRGTLGLLGELLAGAAMGFAASHLAERMDSPRPPAASLHLALVLITACTAAAGLAMLAGGQGLLAACLCGLIAGWRSRPLGHAALAVEEALGAAPMLLVALMLGVSLGASMLALLADSATLKQVLLSLLLGLVLALLLRPLSLLMWQRSTGVLPLGIMTPPSPFAVAFVMLMVLVPGSPGKMLLVTLEPNMIVITAMAMVLTSWLIAGAASLLAPLLSGDGAIPPELATPHRRFAGPKDQQVIEQGAAPPARPAKQATKPAAPSRNPALARARAAAEARNAKD